MFSSLAMGGCSNDSKVESDINTDIVEENVFQSEETNDMPSGTNEENEDMEIDENKTNYSASEILNEFKQYISDNMDNGGNIRCDNKTGKFTVFTKPENGYPILMDGKATTFYGEISQSENDKTYTAMFCIWEQGMEQNDYFDFDQLVFSNGDNDVIFNSTLVTDLSFGFATPMFQIDFDNNEMLSNKTVELYDLLGSENVDVCLFDANGTEHVIDISESKMDIYNCLGCLVELRKYYIDE